MNIHDPASTLLLLKRSSMQGETVDWPGAIASRGKKTDYVYHFLELVKLLPHYRDRVRTQTSLWDLLRLWDMPVLKQNCILCAKNEFEKDIKTWARREIGSRKIQFPYWHEYARSRLRVTATGTQSWRSKLMTIQRYISDLDWSSVEKADIQVQQAIMSGNDMLRIAANNKTPATKNIGEALQEQLVENKKWLRRTCIDGNIAAGVAHLPRIHMADEGENATFGKAAIDDLWLLGERCIHNAAADAVVHDSSLPASDYVVTCEDKDPGVLWQMSGTAAVGRWIKQIRSAGDRWNILDTSEYDLIGFYRRLLGRVLPFSLIPKNRDIFKQNLPYACFTVKL